MINLNKVFIAGRLTRKPQLRKTSNGLSVTDLVVALNRDFVDMSGYQREACFVDVTVWGKQAELCTDALQCSSNVLIEGRLHLDNWERHDGEKRSRLRVVAETVQFFEEQTPQEKDEFSLQEECSIYYC